MLPRDDKELAGEVATQIGKFRNRLPIWACGWKATKALFPFGPQRGSNPRAPTRAECNILQVTRPRVGILAAKFLKKCQRSHPKRVLRKAPAQNRIPRTVLKKLVGGLRFVEVVLEREEHFFVVLERGHRALFSASSLAPCFGPALSVFLGQSFGSLPGVGFVTSKKRPPGS